MLKFLKKAEVWKHLDARMHAELGWKDGQFHMTTWQDIAIYAYLQELSGQRIAEIGGGNSRILRKLSGQNTCVNIDKLEGQHGDPKGDQDLPGVETIKVFMGDFSDQLEENDFDYLISVSVVEHVPDSKLAAFFEDMLRIMKPGAVSLHAIDMYLAGSVLPSSQRRLDLYRAWLDDPRVKPLAVAEADQALFTTDMVSNPDMTMWQWSTTAPTLKELRERSQGVSLLLGFSKD